MDDYHLAATLDGWVADRWIPQLPATVLLVIASRHPHTAHFPSTVPWLPLIRPLPLAPLTRPAAGDLLSNCGVPEGLNSAILGLVGGHPEALLRVAERVRARNTTDFDASDQLEVVHFLTTVALEEVDAALRPAVEAMAVAGSLSPHELAEMLRIEDGEPLFRRLRHLSFVHVSPLGIEPISAFRTALSLELQWRDPDRHSVLLRRAFKARASRLGGATGRHQEHLVSGVLRLLQTEPAVSPYIEWERLSHGRFHPAEPEDFEAIIASASHHEGAASGEKLADWLQVEPGAFRVARRGRCVTAWLQLLRLRDPRARSANWPTDPITAAAWRLLESNPLRQGEEGLLLRSWMDTARYQDISAGQTAVMREVARALFRASGCAAFLFAASEADHWATPLRFFGSAKPPAHAVLGEHEFDVFSIDWREWVAPSWESVLALPTRPTSGTPYPLQARILSSGEFRDAVRAALKHFGDADALRKNPLVRSRLVLSVCHSSQSVRVDALRDLISAASETLGADPKTRRYHLAVRDFWLEPRGTQEAVAEQLSVPFSTFRRHLTRGADLIAAALWYRELSRVNAE